MSTTFEHQAASLPIECVAGRSWYCAVEIRTCRLKQNKGQRGEKAAKS